MDMVRRRRLNGNPLQMKAIPTLAALGLCTAIHAHADVTDGWTNASPREEIRPEFQQSETGGRSGHGTLAICADEREGLHGWWQKSFPSPRGGTIECERTTPIIEGDGGTSYTLK
jgi:hypothetical protein